MIAIVDNVLEVNNEVYVESVEGAAPTRILDALEDQVSLFQLQGQGNNLTVIGRSVGVVALRINESSLDDGLAFGVSENTTVNLLFTDIDNITENMNEASVVLPPNITSHLSPNASSKYQEDQLPGLLIVVPVNENS